MLGLFATASRRTLHCHSPGVVTVARHHCRTPPVHRCPRQQRQRVTEGTALWPHRMGPINAVVVAAAASWRCWSLQTRSGSGAAAASAGPTTRVRSGRATTWNCWRADAGFRIRRTRWCPAVTVRATCTRTTPDAASSPRSARVSTSRAAPPCRPEERCDANAPSGKPRRSAA